MDADKIVASVSLGQAAHYIVEASMDTEKMVVMCLFSNQYKLAEKAIDTYFEFLVSILPKTIGYFETLGMVEAKKKSEDFLQQVKNAVDKIANGADRKYTLDEILKQAGVTTDGNRER